MVPDFQPQLFFRTKRGVLSERFAALIHLVSVKTQADGPPRIAYLTNAPAVVGDATRCCGRAVGMRGSSPPPPEGAAPGSAGGAFRPRPILSTTQRILAPLCVLYRVKAELGIFLAGCFGTNTDCELGVQCSSSKKRSLFVVFLVYLRHIIMK